MATAKEMAEVLLQALRWGGCERARSLGFLEAWPR